MSLAQSARGSLSGGWTAGEQSAVDDDESLFRAIATVKVGGSTVANNLAAGAMTLLITLMIVLLAALVGGKFAAAIPSGSPFAPAINTVTDTAGTAFVIFGVSLLAIPTVAVLAYMITRLGGFVGFGGPNRLRRRR